MAKRIVNSFNAKLNQVYTSDITYATFTSYSGGKYSIKSVKDFWRFYAKVVATGAPLHLIENHKGLLGTPVLFDIDFNKMCESPDEICVVPEVTIIKFVDALIRVIRDNVIAPDEFDILVTQKPKATMKQETDAFKAKFGFHLQIPDVPVTFGAMHVIRHELLSLGAELFEDVSYFNELCDVIDHCVIDQNGMTMFGSRKPDGFCYDLTHVFHVTGDAVTDVFKPEVPSADELPELSGKRRAEFIKKYNFSLRLFDEPLSVTDDCIAKIMNLPTDKVLLKDPNAINESRARKAKKVAARTINEDNLDILLDSLPAAKKLLPKPMSPETTSQFLAALPQSWSDSYDGWFTVMTEIAASIVYYKQLPTDDMKTIIAAYEDAFMTFSNRSAKFNQDENKKRLRETIKSTHARVVAGQSVRTDRSLRMHVRSANPAAYIQLRRVFFAEQYIDSQYDIEQHIAPGTQLIGDKVIWYNKKKCEPFAEGYDESVTDPVCIVERSAMGSGKTFQINKFLELRKPASAISVVPRISLGIDQKNTFELDGEKVVEADGDHLTADATMSMYAACAPYAKKFVLHTDTADLDRHDYLISCVESIHKTHRIYDTVILDEASATFRQFRSTTVSDKMATWRRFNGILKSAKRVIVTDATLDGVTVFLLTSMLPDFKFVVRENSFQLYPRTFRIILDEVGVKRRAKALLELAINKFLEEGLRVVCPSSSKKFLENWEQKMCDIPALCSKISGNLKIYTADTSDKVLKEDIADIENSWDGPQFIGYSPVIGAGVNFAKPGVFDKGILFVSNTSVKGAAALQSAFRVRCLKDTAHLVHIENIFNQSYLPTTLEDVKQTHAARAEQFRKDYHKFVDKELKDRTDVRAMTKQLKAMINELKTMDAQSLADVLNTVDAIINKHVDSALLNEPDEHIDEQADLLCELHRRFELDDNLWTTNYTEMFKQLVTKFGHKWELVTASEFATQLEIDNVVPSEVGPEDDPLNVTLLTASPCYEDIETIDQDEYARIYALRNAKNADADMKFQLVKYEFCHDLDALCAARGVPMYSDERKAAIFDAMKGNSRFKQNFANLKLEFKATDHVICDVLRRCRRIDIADDDLQRKTVVAEIYTKLGMKGILDSAPLIPMSTFDSDLAAWEALIKRAWTVFGKRDRSTGEMDMNIMSKRLNGILREYADVTLAAHEKDKTNKVLVYKVELGDFANLFNGV